LFARLDSELIATVVAVNRLTSTIVEVVVKAPLARGKFRPGSSTGSRTSRRSHPSSTGRGSRWRLALTGAWVDPVAGLLGTIVLEMG